MESNKRINIARAVSSTVLPLIYLYLCFGFSLGIALFFPSLLIICVLYAIPHFVTASKVKSDEIKTVKPFIVADTLFSLLPSVGSCLFASIILDAFFSGFELLWLFSAVLMIIFVFVTLYFWLRYYINNKVIKNIKKPRR